MMDKLEYRTNPSERVELRREEGKDPHIDGRGLVFNQESQDLGGFREVIKPEAVRNVKWDDVYAFINHDSNIVMGRTKSGTMEVEVREDGVYYSINPPKGSERFIDNIERGDIDGSSFAFRVAPNGETWEKRDDDVVIRTITEILEIREMGPVVSPAYIQSTADVALRSMEKWKSEEEEEEGMNESTRMKIDMLRLREKDNVNFK